VLAHELADAGAAERRGEEDGAEIPVREDSQQVPVLDDGEMPEPVVSHEAVRMPRGLAGPHGHEVAHHHVADGQAHDTALQPPTLSDPARRRGPGARSHAGRAAPSWAGRVPSAGAACRPTGPVPLEVARPDGPGGSGAAGATLRPAGA